MSCRCRGASKPFRLSRPIPAWAEVIGDKGSSARVSDADAQDPDAAAARKGVVDQLLAAAEAHLTASGLDRNLFRAPQVVLPGMYHVIQYGNVTVRYYWYLFKAV